MISWYPYHSTITGIGAWEHAIHYTHVKYESTPRVTALIFVKVDLSQSYIS